MSGLVTGTLLILVAIGAAFAIYFIVNNFTADLSKGAGGALSNVKFEIRGLTTEDILFDRFAIENTGEVVLDSYAVKIDGELVPIVVHKIINPQEVKYIYLDGTTYPTGEHMLTVESKEYIQSVEFKNLEGSEVYTEEAEDWHIVVSDVQIVN